MLRWMSGITRKDRVSNRYIRGSLKVVEVFKKVHKTRLRWLRHVKRNSEEQIAREAMEGEVQGRRRRGRPKISWKDRITADMVERSSSVQDFEDRSNWRRLIQNSNTE